MMLEVGVEYTDGKTDGYTDSSIITYASFHFLNENVRLKSV
jgi:hypothetical protein